jgi:hypothetical protein
MRFSSSIKEEKEPFGRTCSPMAPWKFLVLCSVAVKLSLSVSAQNNYWTQAYSAYSTLTGGAGMSNEKDNSIFFYNPGAIGFVDTVSFNISANIYGINHVKLNNAVGTGLHLTSNKFDINAQVMAGNISFKKVPKLNMIYGYILRNFTRFEFEQQNDMDFDVIPQAPGLEYYRGKFDFRYNFAEYWAGIAAGYRISEHVSVGLGYYFGYIMLRDQLFQESSVDAISPTGTPYIASVTGRFKYHLDHINMMFKPGVDLRFGKFKVGLAAMLPSIKLWGKGTVYQSIATVNMNLYFPDTTNVLARYPNLIVVGDQQGVDVQYRSPPSVSLGLEYGDSKWRLAFSAEYFFPLEEYDIIRGREDVYARPALAYGNTVIPDFMRVRTASYEVLNLGIGIDRSISPKLALLAGFRTDFNNKVPLFRKEYTDYITASNPEYWNYLHYSIGIAIHKPNSRTFIGLTYRQGFSSYQKSYANPTEPTLTNFLSGPQEYNMTSTIHGVGLVIGYTNFTAGRSPFKSRNRNKQ